MADIRLLVGNVSCPALGLTGSSLGTIWLRNKFFGSCCKVGLALQAIKP